MVIGLCTVELYIPDGHSLKSKRQVLLSLKDRLRDKFNVSVAEVGDQNLWQKAVLGIACVANERAYVNQVLDQAVNLIRSVPPVELVQSRIELL
ncbi:MAG: DUF503 domain-containing protein [Nitrospirota bacterium]|jgi:uncharacterized protein YlxP (DUF503 family)